MAADTHKSISHHSPLPSLQRSVSQVVCLETALRPSPVTPQRPPPCPGPRGLHLAPGFAYTTSSSTIPRPTRELRRQAPHGCKRPQFALSLAGRLVLQGYDFSLVRSKLHTRVHSTIIIIIIKKKKKKKVRVIVCLFSKLLPKTAKRETSK